MCVSEENYSLHTTQFDIPSRSDSTASPSLPGVAGNCSKGIFILCNYSVPHCTMSHLQGGVQTSDYHIKTAIMF